MSTTASNPDCWVTFWNKDNFKQHTRTFTFAPSPADSTNDTGVASTKVYDLSKEHYADSRQQLDDSISSLKTGPSTWLSLFTRHNFDGAVLNVGPNTSLAALNSDALAAAFPGLIGNFDNTIVSFVLYDSCPNYWSNIRHAEATLGNNTTSFEAGTCWVKLYQGPNFGKGFPFMLTGPGQLVSMHCIVFSMTDVVPSSLTTGPATWVRLYGELNQKATDTPLFSFGPNTVIADLSRYGTEQVKSVSVYAAEPASFYGNSAQLPPTVLALQHQQTATSLEDVLAGALKCVPQAGPMLAGLLTALWPSSTDPHLVWNDMIGFVNALVQSALATDKLQQLNDIITGLAGNISQYQVLAPGPDKVSKLGDIMTLLENSKPAFRNANNQLELTYLVAFSTITVVMLAEQAYNYALVSGLAENDNQHTFYQALDTAVVGTAYVPSLAVQVATAAADVLTTRLGLIGVSPQGNLANGFVLTDTHTSLVHAYATQAEAEAAQALLLREVAAQYSLLLAQYTCPAATWYYLRTANTARVPASGNLNFPTTRFLELPTPQVVQATVATTPTASIGEAFHTPLHNGKITGVTIYSAGLGRITGILFSYDNQAPTLHGISVAGGLTVSVTFSVDEEEYITAVYGRNQPVYDGSTVTCLTLAQLFFRTNLGRDFGTGGGSGDMFFAYAPQGVKTKLLSVQGSVYSGYFSEGYSSCLEALGFTWQYEYWG